MARRSPLSAIGPFPSVSLGAESFAPELIHAPQNRLASPRAQSPLSRRAAPLVNRVQVGGLSGHNGSSEGYHTDFANGCQGFFPGVFSRRTSVRRKEEGQGNGNQRRGGRGSRARGLAREWVAREWEPEGKRPKRVRRMRGCPCYATRGQNPGIGVRRAGRLGAHGGRFGGRETRVEAASSRLSTRQDAASTWAAAPQRLSWPSTGPMPLHAGINGARIGLHCKELGRRNSGTAVGVRTGFPRPDALSRDGSRAAQRR